ncbi:hypothetical protein [Aureimonas glaciei]|uniref:hypothetical protein n=1 Tax=Aureimonas glaciei TaxID=1776957 RepID=UPI00166AED9C|nr:hypothetical protein [Aureimonas glaciei]
MTSTRRISAALKLTGLLSCAVFALTSPQASAQTTPRPIPEGFVLPGPPPTNAPAGTGSGAPAPAAPPGAEAAPQAVVPPAGLVSRPIVGSLAAAPAAVAPTAGTTQLLGTVSGSEHIWPCVQRKVDQVSAAQVWPGPPIETAEGTARSDAISQFVASVAPRRVPLGDAEAKAREFVRSMPESDRRTRATAAFAELLATLNAERTAIMNGIERYGARQQALAARLRGENAAIGEMRNKGEMSKAADAQEALLWDTRLFEERRKSLTYVCEVPVLIEQRLFALGRAMSGEL